MLSFVVFHYDILFFFPVRSAVVTAELFVKIFNENR